MNDQPEDAGFHPAGRPHPGPSGTGAHSGASRRAFAGLLRVAEPPAPALVALVATIGPVEAWEAVRRRDVAVAGREVMRLTEPRVAGRSADALDDLAAHDLDQAGRAGATLIGLGDAAWPDETFAGLEYVRSHPGSAGGAPLALYVRGGELPVAGCSVAVVGSRAATPYGLRMATELAADLTAAGITVVSGAAFGIDAAAHRGALHTAGGSPAGLATVAVLGCGIDRPYPVAHAGLLDSIASCGAVITEYPPGTTPARHRFLVRNRLIAAFAAGTVVVEAGARSGSLNTAAAADLLSRHVMAMPGPVSSAVSLGCHELIRNRNAELVTGARDVLAALCPLGMDAAGTAGSPAETGEAGIAERPTDRLAGTAALVYEALPARGSTTTVDLATEAALPGAAVVGALAVLELEGLAERAGGRWRRCR
jgi:DNA processing protein